MKASNCLVTFVILPVLCLVSQPNHDLASAHAFPNRVNIK